jgi:hypothetical protein
LPSTETALTSRDNAPRHDDQKHPEGELTLPAIAIPPIDSQNSPELHELHVRYETRAAEITEDQAQFNADLAKFREQNPADVNLSDAAAFRDRQALILASELRLRMGLLDFDRDVRAELGSKVRDQAFQGFEEKQKRITNGLLKLGFQKPDKGGNGDQVLLAQLVQRHPEVMSFRGRVDELASRSNDRSFAEQNQAAIAQLESRIRQAQLKAAAV